MNIKYWLRFLPRPFSTIAFSTTLFAGQSLALADMLTTILQDLEDHSLAWSSFELKSMSTNSEPSQEQSFQCGYLRVHIAHVIFVPKIYTIENFRDFNFRCQLDQRKYFNTKLFPICGISLICVVQISMSMCFENLDKCSSCPRVKNEFAACSVCLMNDLMIRQVFLGMSHALLTTASVGDTPCTCYSLESQLTWLIKLRT